MLGNQYGKPLIYRKILSKSLKNFLDYMDGRAPADDFTREIDSEVVTAKNCDEWRREYMTLALEMEKEKKKAAEEVRINDIIGMLKENISVDVISRITNYSIEQIKEIGKKNALL